MPWSRSPLLEPLTLTEAKAYLKVDHTDEDTLIGQMIREARSWTETFLGRALIDQTWKLTLERFPASGQHNPHASITLPKGHTIAVTAFTYRDTDGTLGTLTGMEVSPIGSDYQWDLGDEGGGVLRPAWGDSWPATRDTIDPLNITFRAGYTTSAGIPEQILAGLKWKLADLYATRGDQDVAGRQDVAIALLTPWKLAWF